MDIPDFTLPAAAQILWIIGLVVAYLALPVLLVVLTRLVLAARKIARYLEATRVNSKMIPKHLEALPALDETVALLKTAKTTGAAIATGTETLAGVLLHRAGGN